MKYLDFYNNKLQIQTLKNITKVKEIAKNILDKKNNKETHNLNKKIKNYLNRYYFDNNKFDELCKNIINNDFIASFFSKSAKKQNICENTQFEYMKKYMNFSNLKNLPSSGKNCIFIINGKEKICCKNNIQTLKSVDFIEEKNEIKTYFFAKHIDGNGGAQDNQLDDLIECIKNSKFKYDINKKCKVIISGSFYNNNKKLNKLKYYSNKYNIEIINLNEK